MDLRRIGFLLFLVVFWSSLAGASSGQNAPSTAACFISSWPSEKSDLQPDPAMTRGVLANGLRYVIMENHEPEHRVAIYLAVHAGSLNERSNERGVAHYLEHMLFNGTTHFRPGELVKFLQDIGMSYGGDSNAHTEYDETVYNLLLPNGSEEDLRKGFLVMSDYARGALLLEKEVERERGVILAEKRTRDSASYRTYVAASAFKYRGTLLPDRLAIGEESVLRTADQELLKGYYDRWYRPENMLLVVVGDIKARTVVELIDKSFSPLQGVGNAPSCPKLGMVDHSKQEFLYLSEPELGRTEVSVESVWNITPENDSREFERQELYRYAGVMILNNRLRKLQEHNGELLTQVGYDADDLLQHFRSSSIAAATSSEHWQVVLGMLDETLRQALRYGFLPEEVERAKKDIMASLDSAVLTEKSRDSESLARAIIRSSKDNRVFQSPEQERELYGGMISTMTTAEVNEVLRKDWSEDGRLVSVYGDAVIKGENPRQELQKLYTEYSSRAVLPYKEEIAKKFPYLQVPKTSDGVVKKDEMLTGVEAERLVLANNVAITLKRTDFEKNTVKIVVDIGGGKLSEPLPGLALLGQKVVDGSGTGTLTDAELSDLLSGSTVRLNFGVEEESFRWSGSAVSKESELLLQLIYHLIQDPGLREQAYVRAQGELKQMYDGVERDIQGALRTKVERFLADGDPRIGLPPRAQVAAITLDRVGKWILPHLLHDSIEVAVVGDFRPERMKELLLKYFGPLKEREPIVTHSSTLNFPAGKSLDTEVKSSVKKSIVIAAWPTAGFWDIHRTRRLFMLAEILEDRLRQEIREKMGATYSPVVLNMPSRVFGDYGKMLAQVVVAPGREQEILKEIVGIAARLRTNGISEQELERTRGPMLTSLRDNVRTNDYWLYSVLSGSVEHPQQLEWPTTLLADFSGITVGEIDKLAEKYLVPEKMATAVVRPAADAAQ